MSDSCVDNSGVYLAPELNREPRSSVKRPALQLALKQQAKRRRRNTSIAAQGSVMPVIPKVIVKILPALQHEEETKLIHDSEVNISSEANVMSSTSPKQTTMREVLASIPGFHMKSVKRTTRKLSAAAQFQRTKEGCVDLQNPSSILVQANLRGILNKHTFSSLPLLYQHKLIQLLPEVDRVHCSDGGSRLSSTGLSNEFFGRACQKWRERLSSGEFTPEFQQKIRAEAERDRGKLDPWKVKHFEPFWGCRSQSTINNKNENGAAQSDTSVKCPSHKRKFVLPTSITENQIPTVPKKRIVRLGKRKVKRKKCKKNALAVLEHDHILLPTSIETMCTAELAATEATPLVEDAATCYSGSGSEELFSSKEVVLSASNLDLEYACSSHSEQAVSDEMNSSKESNDQEDLTQSSKQQAALSSSNLSPTMNYQMTIEAADEESSDSSCDNQTVQKQDWHVVGAMQWKFEESTEESCDDMDSVLKDIKQLNSEVGHFIGDSKDVSTQANEDETAGFCCASSTSYLPEDKEPSRTLLGFPSEEAHSSDEEDDFSESNMLADEEDLDQTASHHQQQQQLCKSMDQVDVGKFVEESSSSQDFDQSEQVTEALELLQDIKDDLSCSLPETQNVANASEITPDSLVTCDEASKQCGEDGVIEETQSASTQPIETERVIRDEQVVETNQVSVESNLTTIPPCTPAIAKDWLGEQATPIDTRTEIGEAKICTTSGTNDPSSSCNLQQPTTVTTSAAQPTTVTLTLPFPVTLPLTLPLPLNLPISLPPGTTLVMSDPSTLVGLRPNNKVIDKPSAAATSLTPIAPNILRLSTPTPTPRILPRNSTQQPCIPVVTSPGPSRANTTKQSHQSKAPPGTVNLERSYRICQAVIENSPNCEQLKAQLRPPSAFSSSTIVSTAVATLTTTTAARCASKTATKAPPVATSAAVKTVSGKGAKNNAKSVSTSSPDRVVATPSVNNSTAGATCKDMNLILVQQVPASTTASCLTSTNGAIASPPAQHLQQAKQQIMCITQPVDNTDQKNVRLMQIVPKVETTIAAAAAACTASVAAVRSVVPVTNLPTQQPQQLQTQQQFQPVGGITVSPQPKLAQFSTVQTSFPIIQQQQVMQVHQNSGQFNQQHLVQQVVYSPANNWNQQIAKQQPRAVVPNYVPPARTLTPFVQEQPVVQQRISPPVRPQQQQQPQQQVLLQQQQVQQQPQQVQQQQQQLLQQQPLNCYPANVLIRPRLGGPPNLQYITNSQLGMQQQQQQPQRFNVRQPWSGQVQQVSVKNSSAVQAYSVATPQTPSLLQNAQINMGMSMNAQVPASAPQLPSQPLPPPPMGNNTNNNNNNMVNNSALSNSANQNSREAVSSKSMDDAKMVTHNCPCNLKAMIMCTRCGAFCHDDCIGPSQLCFTCTVP